jgi:hypothetical protein
MATSSRLALAMVVGLGAAGSAYGAPVTETQGRVEINWSNLRLRFYGESATAPGDGAGEDAQHSPEKRAWVDGLAQVGDVVRDLHTQVNGEFQSNKDQLAQDASAAARQASSAVTSYNTTYYGNGSVRVHLETALPRALASSSIRFRQKEAAAPQMTQYTGVVLELDKSIKPRATYQIVDEKGEVLFDVHDMSEGGYRKNLMGRWFRKPQPAELGDAVGKHPLKVDARANDDGRLVVARADWDSATDGHRALLVNGLVALALP